MNKWKLYSRKNHYEYVDYIPPKEVTYIKTFDSYIDILPWLRENGDKTKVYLVENYVNGYLNCIQLKFTVFKKGKPRREIMPMSHIHTKFIYENEWVRTSYVHESELVFTSETKQYLGNSYTINGLIIKVN